MKGFYHRILTVNLTERTFGIEALPDEAAKNYLGGKGLATCLLFERNPPGVDPFDPDNVVIFATGPVTGSSVWGSCRYGVFTKSPQTRFYTESYSGGRVPEAIDSTGFDAVVIQGKSRLPTVLGVFPEGVEFHDAGNIWGMDTHSAEDAVHERFGRSSGGPGRSGAVVIGPAGEKLVRFAVIENDYWRSAGRTGAGAVLGSKLLKAVLFHGDRKRPVYDSAALREYAKQFAGEVKEHPGVKAYKSMGTPQMVKVMNMANAFPTRYWAEGRFDRWEKISAEALHSRFDVIPHACLKCFMACGRMSTVREGRHAGLRIEGPEYETIYAFGGLCLIDSLEEIAYLNDICDRLGMDTISAGNLCAFAIEAARRNRIDYRIDYGDSDAVARLLEMISGREGIGDILAEGIRHAAAQWGLEDMAVHVKGLEPAGYDPRVLKGMGLGYATSDRGACHLRATFYKPELAGMIPPGQVENKAELFIDFEDRLTLFDTLILCRFYRDFYPWDEIRQVIAMVTGMDLNESDLRKKAASICTLVRRFNLREGLQPGDDRLPARLHRELEKTGHRITTDELEYMLRDYYLLRGWDEQGIPGD